jgi:hypothetical protein
MKIARPGLVGCMFVALASSGCSSGETSPPKDPTVVVAVDCSRSVRGQQRDWIHAILGIAEETLLQERVLRVGGFAGELTGVQWLPPEGGRALGPVTGGGIERRRIRTEEAASLRPLLERELRVKSIPGTDWLSALEAAADQQGVYRVYLFSDLVQQAEGINLAQRKTKHEILVIAREWAPRLKQLRGKDVVSVGGGQKLNGRIPDTQGVELFSDLAELVPFHPETLSTLS